MSTGAGSIARLEGALTRGFLYTVIGLTALVVLALGLVVGVTNVTLDEMTKVVDAVLKILAIVVTGSWAVNRYFANRVDALQLRVDPDVGVVAPGSFAPDRAEGLLLYKLNLVNTSKVLFSDYRLKVEIASTEPGTAQEVEYYDIAQIDWHQGGPIEPGSWSAVSDAVIIPAGLRAVRISLNVESHAGNSWTWHQLFSLNSPLPDPTS